MRRPPEPEYSAPWWAALAGGVLFAIGVYGLLWLFAILGWLLEALG